MRKIAILAVLALLTGMLFANGSQEGQPAVTGPFGEKVSLTGTFKLNQGFPELTSGGKTYALMAPGARMPGYYGTLVKEGTTISVEGYRANPGPRPGQPNQEVIFVQKARVDGKEYEVMHARGGKMRGNGPGYGPGPGGQGGPGMGPQGRGRW